MTNTWLNVAKSFIIILLGFVGMAIYSVGYHLYQDHKNLHAVFVIIENAQKAQQAK
jgi:hypothetical protein